MVANMGEWKQCKLRDFCETNASSYSANDNYSFVNYLDTGNITKNIIDEIQFIDIEKDKLPSRARRKVRNNSIVYSTVRPNQLHYGIIKEQPENFLVSTGFTVIDVDDKVADADFIYYYLTQYEVTESMQAIGEQSTSAYPSIKASDLEDLDIYLPNLENQKKISVFLKSLDEKIELNNKINSNLYSQISTIFKSWVVDMDNYSGKMPADWSLVPLQDLCTTVTKGTTPTTLGKAFTDSGINFVKVEAILDNHYIDITKFAYIDEETNQMLKRSIIEKGDIVFTIAGSLGRFSLVDETIIPANTNQAVAIIRPNTELMSSEYLYSFFVGNWHNDYYSKRVQQAVQANLSLTTIKSLPIIVMSDADMKKYTELITPLVQMIKLNEQENRTLSATRDGLLPKLMSGEIDLSNIFI